MKREVLIAVSRDGSAWYGLRFVSWFFRNKSQLDVSLLCIARDPASWLGEVRFSSERAELERQEKAVRELSEKVLQDARQYLLRSGFAKSSLKAMLGVSKFDTAADLARSTREGLYDALVLGRRGLSRLEELMRDSVSSAMLAEEVTFPLWICRAPIPERRNVLVCVDGSEASLRAADHVGFMVAEEPQHAVTLFVVEGGLGEQDVHEALVAGHAALQANGVDENRITQRVVRSANEIEAVMAEADAGPYAVVAVGGAGRSRKGLKRFASSMSMQLMRSLEHSALWVVH